MVLSTVRGSAHFLCVSASQELRTIIILRTLFLAPSFSSRGTMSDVCVPGLDMSLVRFLKTSFFFVFLFQLQKCPF